LEQRIEGAPYLEGPGSLQAFGLQPQPPVTEIVPRQQRGGEDVRTDTVGCCLDLSELDGLGLQHHAIKASARALVPEAVQQDVIEKLSQPAPDASCHPGYNVRIDWSCRYLLESGFGWEMVGATGVEPVTSSLSWKRSYQLSYAPAKRDGLYPRPDR
jgi:hypothetical protein